MSRRDIVVVAVLGTAMFVGMGILSYKEETNPDRGPTWARQQRPKEAARRFNRIRGRFGASIKRWTASPGLKRAEPGQGIEGKIAVVDKGTGRLDEAHMQMPVTMLAERPEEVQAVAWLEWVPGQSASTPVETRGSCTRARSP